MKNLYMIILVFAATVASQTHTMRIAKAARSWSKKTFNPAKKPINTQKRFNSTASNTATPATTPANSVTKAAPKKRGIVNRMARKGIKMSAFAGLLAGTAYSTGEYIHQNIHDSIRKDMTQFGEDMMQFEQSKLKSQKKMFKICEKSTDAEQKKLVTHFINTVQCNNEDNRKCIDLSHGYVHNNFSEKEDRFLEAIYNEQNPVTRFLNRQNALVMLPITEKYCENNNINTDNIKAEDVNPDLQFNGALQKMLVKTPTTYDILKTYPKTQYNALKDASITGYNFLKSCWSVFSPQVTVDKK